MLNAAVYCTKNLYIDELFGCLQKYRDADTEHSINFSLFFSLEKLEKVVSRNIDYGIYILVIENGDMVSMNYARALYNLCENCEMILLLHSEEYLLQARLDCPKAQVCLLSDPLGITAALHTAEDRISKTDAFHKSIEINTHEGKKLIPYAQILYIEYEDKRLNYHLTDRSVIISRTIRVPMAEYLSTLLEDKRFIRPHRAFVINIERAMAFDSKGILMEDGKRICVSKLIEKPVLKEWKSIIMSKQPRMTHLNAAIRYCESHVQQLEFLRMQPFAQCIIRVDVDSFGIPFDFVFMFVNEALCKLEGKTEKELMGASFYDVFANADSKWLPQYYATAYNGDSRTFESYSPEIGKTLKIVCYQISMGYCGCILSEIVEAEKPKKGKEPEA